MADPLEGIVLIDKEEGVTSSGVVQRVRRILSIRKAGHAGTLDPFATGLLIVLLGQGTKLSSYLMSAEKSYSATLRLGIETDTLDPTGQVVRTRPVPALKQEFIREQARRLVGEIEQVPPDYSALRVNGQRAYRMARKGIKVGLEKRKVTVSSLRITSVDLPHVTLEVACSKGTYIRSLAADLGEQLGTGGHLTALRRLSCGSFTVRDAVRIVDGEAASSPGTLRERTIPLGEALPHMREIRMDPRMALKIRNGYQPEWTDVFPGSDPPGPDGDHIRLLEGMNLIAVMRVLPSPGAGNGRVKIMRVFH